MPVSCENSQISKDIEMPISVFISYSVLYRHIVKHPRFFAAASIFNFQLIVSVYSKTLIMACAVSSSPVIAHYF